MPAAEMHAPLTPDDFHALMAPFGLGRGASLALGVSGGPDSMALLWLAARAGYRVTALTVDHALRPGSAEEADRVAGWAQALGVPHVTLRREGPVPPANIQAEARAARYDLLTGWCRTAGAAALLVAHTREDQAETVLLRLARGSGVDGLAAMAPETHRAGIRIVRPLLNVPRARLAATLCAHDQPWIADPSNGDPRHARVRMRHLAAQLEAEGLDAARLAATARAMRRARTALEGWTRAHLARAVRFDCAGCAVADLEALLDAPDEVQLRALAGLLRAVGGAAYPPRLAALERLAGALRERARSGRGFAGATLGGVRLVLRHGGFMAMREARAALAAVPADLASPGGPVLWDGRFELMAHAPLPAGARVAALGAQGWRAVRADAPERLRRLPAAAGAVLPAVFAGGRLLSVPHLAAGRDGPVAARFVGARRAGLVFADADQPG